MSLRPTWKYSRDITLMSLPVWRHLSLCILASLPCLDLFLLMVLFYLTHSKLVTCLLATYFKASGSEFVVILGKEFDFMSAFQSLLSQEWEGHGGLDLGPCPYLQPGSGKATLIGSITSITIDQNRRERAYQNFPEKERVNLTERMHTYPTLNKIKCVEAFCKQQSIVQMLIDAIISSC